MAVRLAEGRPLIALARNINLSLHLTLNCAHFTDERTAVCALIDRGVLTSVVGITGAA